MITDNGQQKVFPLEFVNETMCASYLNKTNLLFQMIITNAGRDTNVSLAADSSPRGFIAYGTQTYGYADFDNFKVEKAVQ